MSGRLDQEREKELQPKRIEFACNSLKELGYEITFKDSTRIEFEFQGEVVKFFPYSGWHSGKSIKDGRGWKSLKKQVTQ